MESTIHILESNPH